jgi:hypothetical protein
MIARSETILAAGGDISGMTAALEGRNAASRRARREAVDARRRPTATHSSFVWDLSDLRFCNCREEET